MEVKRCIENDLLVISGIENNLNKYFESRDFQDKVFYILKDRNILDTTKDMYLITVNEKGLLNLLKELDLYRCYGREDNKIVLLHPDLWTLVTMESSPKILLQASY